MPSERDFSIMPPPPTPSNALLTADSSRQLDPSMLCLYPLEELTIRALRQFRDQLSSLRTQGQQIYRHALITESIRHAISDYLFANQCIPAPDERVWRDWSDEELFSRLEDILAKLQSAGGNRVGLMPTVVPSLQDRLDMLRLEYWDGTSFAPIEDFRASLREGLSRGRTEIASISQSQLQKLMRRLLATAVNVIPSEKDLLHPQRVLHDRLLAKVEQMASFDDFVTHLLCQALDLQRVCSLAIDMGYAPPDPIVFMEQQSFECHPTDDFCQDASQENDEKGASWTLQYEKKKMFDADENSVYSVKLKRACNNRQSSSTTAAHYQRERRYSDLESIADASIASNPRHAPKVSSSKTSSSRKSKKGNEEYEEEREFRSDPKTSIETRGSEKPINEDSQSKSKDSTFAPPPPPASLSKQSRQEGSNSAARNPKPQSVTPKYAESKSIEATPAKAVSAESSTPAEPKTSKKRDHAEMSLKSPSATPQPVDREKSQRAFNTDNPDYFEDSEPFQIDRRPATSKPAAEVIDTKNNGERVKLDFLGRRLSINGRCPGCGKGGHNRNNCRHVGHPNYNEEDLPWTQSSIGRAWYEKNRAVEIPLRLTLDDQEIPFVPSNNNGGNHRNHQRF